jgi:hypothetical protein
MPKQLSPSRKILSDCFWRNRLMSFGCGLIVYAADISRATKAFGSIQLTGFSTPEQNWLYLSSTVRIEMYLRIAWLPPVLGSNCLSRYGESSKPCFRFRVKAFDVHVNHTYVSWKIERNKYLWNKPLVFGMYTPDSVCPKIWADSNNCNTRLGSSKAEPVGGSRVNCIGHVVFSAFFVRNSWLW